MYVGLLLNPKSGQVRLKHKLTEFKDIHVIQVFQLLHVQNINVKRRVKIWKLTNYN